VPTSTIPHVFTGRMPFLPPNQQCQSTEGNATNHQQSAIGPGIHLDTEKLPLPFYGHYTGQPALSSTDSEELENFVLQPACPD